MLSNTAEYALRAVLYVAQHEGLGLVRVNEAADALDIPKNYLSKVFHELARGGVLESSRGQHGGFRLARPAGKISLLNIVSRFDQISERRRCLLGKDRCSDHTACLVHERWKDVSEQVATFFRVTTVADLMDGVSSAA
ncbi:MAG TPA: Rrf2 family transcriptional regulator [Gemmatimonadales bacterium]